MNINEGDIIRFSLGSSNSAACVIAGYLLAAKSIDTDTISADFNRWLDNVDLEQMSASLETALATTVMPSVPAGHTPDNWYTDAFFAAWLLMSRPDLIKRDPSLGARLSRTPAPKVVAAITGQVNNDGDFAIRQIGDLVGINTFILPKDSSGKPKHYYAETKRR
jgi:hypothetical protein